MGCVLVRFVCWECCWVGHGGWMGGVDLVGVWLAAVCFFGVAVLFFSYMCCHFGLGVSWSCT